MAACKSEWQKAQKAIRLLNKKLDTEHQIYSLKNTPTSESAERAKNDVEMIYTDGYKQQDDETIERVFTSVLTQLDKLQTCLDENATAEEPFDTDNYEAFVN